MNLELESFDEEDNYANAAPLVYYDYDKVPF